MPSIILIRGGGDLATGVAIRLIRSGLRVVVTELPQPLAVRRTVSFCEAVYDGQITVEGITARAVTDPADTYQILSILTKQQIPVLIDPDCVSAQSLSPTLIVDGRMTKHPPVPISYTPLIYIGLGPGFVAGENCQAVVETRRGHNLGRVYWQGAPQPDTGQPEGDPTRVLRAPADGELVAYADIGNLVEVGQVIAKVGGKSITAPFKGLLRGLIHPGLVVTEGLKVGDLDAHDDPCLYTMVSDKALAVGGGVLEAVLSRSEARARLWD